MPNQQHPGLVGVIGQIYKSLAHLLDYGQSPFLLLIRLYIGYQCMISGYGHLTHFHNMVDKFIEWKIPAPAVNVAVSGTTELVGGALLLVGFASRIIGGILTGNFIVAIIAPNLADSEYRDNLIHFWNHPNVIINDTAFPFLVTSLIVLLFGPGWLSIDGILQRPKNSGRGFPVDLA